MGHANAGNGLGYLPGKRGDRQGAEAAYRRADEAGSLLGAFNVGATLHRMGDMKGAEAAYRRADRRGNADGALAAGDLLRRRGELHAAEVMYERALKRATADEDELIIERATNGLKLLGRSPALTSSANPRRGTLRDSLPE